MCDGRYTNTTDNDLSYWGLDYPPVSAYQASEKIGLLFPPQDPYSVQRCVDSRMEHMQSWLYGKAIERYAPEAVALHSSRGIETMQSKLLMRWSVIFSDMLGECSHTSSLCCSALVHPAISWADCRVVRCSIISSIVHVRTCLCTERDTGDQILDVSSTCFTACGYAD